jgi:hypothetical protein
MENKKKNKVKSFIGDVAKGAGTAAAGTTLVGLAMAGRIRVPKRFYNAMRKGRFGKDIAKEVRTKGSKLGKSGKRGVTRRTTFWHTPGAERALLRSTIAGGGILGGGKNLLSSYKEYKQNKRKQ